MQTVQEMTLYGNPELKGDIPKDMAYLTKLHTLLIGHSASNSSATGLNCAFVVRSASRATFEI